MLTPPPQTGEHRLGEAGAEEQRGEEKPLAALGAHAGGHRAEQGSISSSLFVLAVIGRRP